MSARRVSARVSFTKETAATLKRLYTAFDPTARVEIEDQDLFVDRPGSVAQAIIDELELEPSGRWIVCGAMGCGKSSELVELARRLGERYAVIGLDLPRSVIRVDRLTPPEVLYLIGLAAVRAAKELWDHPLPDAAIQELHSAFNPLLAADAPALDYQQLIQGVALFTLGLATGPAAAAAAKPLIQGAASALAQKIKSARATPLGGVARATRDGDPDLERLQSAVAALLAEVSTYRPPIVLVDGLDKIQDIAAIRELFSGSQALAIAAAPVVYTGPITLMLRTEWQQVASSFKRERLTTVIVQAPRLNHIQIDGPKIEAGIAALQDVIARRLRRVGIAREKLFASLELERQLIETSGGLMRELIQLIHRAVRCCHHKHEAVITAEIVDSAIMELRREYEITLNTRRVRELVHVAKTGEPSGEDEVSSELLLGGYVLPYTNGRAWFAPHPILKGLRQGLF